MTGIDNSWQESEQIYLAFLLRCWQEVESDSREEWRWRFAVVRSGSERRERGFSSIEDLSAYLKTELQQANRS